MKFIKPKNKPRPPPANDNGNNSQNQQSQSKKQNQYQQMETDDNKRAITYQMAKNKGLTPHRKKEQRNPRVKYKNKYRKAVIKRKGAIREVRKELKRYDGEYSGINASVIKSRKLK